MFDSHNAEDEIENHATLVERYSIGSATSMSMKWTVGILAPETTTSCQYSTCYAAKDTRAGFRSKRSTSRMGAETLARESLRYLESVIERLPE